MTPTHPWLARPMPPFTLRSLEVFATVVQARGFGQAAAVLGISQPSVSVHMRSLETKLGQALFVRQPGQTPVLSAAGQALLAFAQETLQRAQAIHAELGTQRRQLRFAAQRFVAQSLLGSTFATLTQAFSQLEVIARTGTYEEVTALFQSGAVDLAFFLTPPEHRPAWPCEPIGRYRLALIASPTHPLARRTQIDPAELSGHAFITPYKGSFFARCMDALLLQAGVKTPLIAAQGEEAGTVRDMVKANMGLACTLRRSVHKDILAGDLVELDVDMPALHLLLCVARRAEATGPEIDQLIDRVRKGESRTRRLGEQAWAKA